MKKRRVFVPVILVILILGCVGIGVFCLTQRDRNKADRQNESREKVLAYPQEVDERGIAIDMRDNPFFCEKQDGYSYPKAETIEYYSHVTDTMRHASVILPANYEEGQRYPVLYLLHGLGGSHRTWLNKDVDVIISNLIYFYDMAPMIIVLPNSEVNEQENADGLELDEKAAVYDKTEEDLMQCLKPYIEEHFPVRTGRENTAIAGNSMGGRNTMNVAFHHPDQFGYVGVFSCASVLDNPAGPSFHPLVKEEELAGKEFEVFMLMVGKQDDVCGWVTYDLHERLEKHGVEHIFYEVEGGHNTYVWQNAIYNFCRRIFR